MDSFISLSEVVAAQNAMVVAIAAIGEALSALQAAVEPADCIKGSVISTAMAAVSTAHSAIAALVTQIAIDPEQLQTRLKEMTNSGHPD
jgi:hypothetical protein